MSKPAPAHFPLRPTPATPWRPLTDAEWEALWTILRPATGRPPKDPRRSWNGIFWVACSKGPWREMPAAFGRPDSAHRTLRRAARARHLQAMLVRVAPRLAEAGDPLRAIAWFIVRAFRRAFRVAPMPFLLPGRLGLGSALPCRPAYLPRPGLSETVATHIRAALCAEGGLSQRLTRALLLLLRHAAGQRRRWRTTD